MLLPEKGWMPARRASFWAVPFFTCAALLLAGGPQGWAQPLPETRVIGKREPPPAPAPPPEPPPEPPAPEPAPPPAMSVGDSRSAPVTNSVGSAPSASEGRINQLDLANQPFLRPAGVLEYIPGFIAADHTGTVKANEYFLRGFFLDHGTDFSIWIDDVPYNQPNHPHLHGYLDVNSLIPELVEYIDFKKGVYYPEAGDFSSAGTARIHLVDSLPCGILKSEVGKDSYYRELIANSGCVGPGVLLYAFEGKYFNGPWEYPENARQFKGVLRYTVGDDSDGFRVTGMGYSGVGRINDNIPLPAVQAGLLDRFGTLDPFEGLSTQRYQINSQWWHRNDAGDVTKANLYYVYYSFSIFTNTTGNLQDPDNGDLIHQFEHRSTFGGNLSQSWNSRLFGDCVRNTVGLQVRNDSIPRLGVEHVVARNLLNVIDEASILESNVGLYFTNEVKWGEKVRTVLGVRGDYFHWHVDDLLPENSGKTEAKLIQPKGSLVLGPWCDTEFYLNGGSGFHSNDARGLFAVDALPFVPGGDLTTGNQPGSPLARSRGAEVGMKTQAIPHLTTTVAVWYLRLASELVFDPVALTGVPRGASERYGVELSNTYRLNGWLTFDADWSASQAHFLVANPDTGGNRVDQAVQTVFSAGPTVRLPSGFFGSLRYKYLGPRDLTDTGFPSSRATNLFDLALGYESLRLSTGIEFLNLFNSNGHEIDFANDVAVNGTVFPNAVTFHPLQPFQARYYLTLKF
jgi:hypothetical protein